MQWIVHVTLAVIATRVDSKCGEYYRNRELQEVDPLIIETKLGELATINIPEPHGIKNATYVLTLPNGELGTFVGLDDMKNNIKIQYKLQLESRDNEMESNKESKELYEISLNVTQEKNSKESYNANDSIDQSPVKKIELGPITEDYFGNWVVATCFIDELGTDTEMFQVVSLHIEEHIKTIPKDSTTVRAHGDLKLRLDRTIPELESCELVAPVSAPYRPYGRDPEELESCGFILERVTARDAGTWRVVGVGRVAYVGELNVIVEDKPPN